MNGYPKSVKEILRDDIEYPLEVIQGMRDFQSSHPWRGTVGRRFKKLRRLNQTLAHVYGIETPTLKKRKINDSFSGASVYNPGRHEITLRGRLSTITFLHEFGHSLGWGEFGATEWSVNLFRKIFPKSFERLVADGHCLIRKKQKNSGP